MHYYLFLKLVVLLILKKKRKNSYQKHTHNIVEINCIITLLISWRYNNMRKTLASCCLIMLIYHCVLKTGGGGGGCVLSNTVLVWLCVVIRGAGTCAGRRGWGGRYGPANFCVSIVHLS